MVNPALFSVFKIEKDDFDVQVSAFLEFNVCTTIDRPGVVGPGRVFCRIFLHKWTASLGNPWLSLSYPHDPKKMKKRPEFQPGISNIFDSFSVRGL